MQETFMKQMYNHSHPLSFTSFGSKRSFYIPIIFFKIFLINKTTDKFILSQFVKKKRIVHNQGAPNIDCSTVVFIFNVCCHSKPSSLCSSTNYAQVHTVQCG